MPAPIVEDSFLSLEVNRKAYKYSAAAIGWAGWALAHPEFESSVNPITTRGADYANHITASPTGFENPAASLCTVVRGRFRKILWPSQNI